MSSQRPFRAIIAGGGPSGLVLAHCLEAANIDFVLLESSPDAAQSSGSGFGLYPQASRVLKQLGLFGKVRALSEPTGDLHQLNYDGSIIAAIPLMPLLEERYVRTCSSIRVWMNWRSVGHR